MNKSPIFKLADVTTLITDGKHGDSRDESGSGFFFLSSKDLRDGRLQYDDPREIKHDDFLETHRRTNLKPGDILLANCGASIGRVGIAQRDERICRTTFQKSISVIKANNKLIDSKYLYFYCLANSRHFVDLGGGTAQPNLLIGDLKRIKIHLPPFLVQKKISAILSAYDELIENNQRRIALLEKMAEEIYREWFVRLRFPGHEKVRFFKGVPQGWRPSCLGNVAKFTMGQSPSSEFYNEVGNGLPFHQGVGTYGERFPRTVTYCSEDGRRAHSGDILFSVRAPVGRLNIADQEMIIGRGLAAIRHKKEHNSYLYYLLKTAFANEDIIGNGSIFNSVGKDELAKFPVFEPEPSLVERFDAMVSKIDKQITMVMQATECSKSSRDALLPRLISGKLSVENLDIQFPPGMEETAYAT